MLPLLDNSASEIHARRQDRSTQLDQGPGSGPADRTVSGAPFLAGPAGDSRKRDFENDERTQAESNLTQYQSKACN